MAMVLVKTAKMPAATNMKPTMIDHPGSIGARVSSCEVMIHILVWGSDIG